MHVPADALLGGEENKGWKQLMHGLAQERMVVAVRSMAMARSAFETTLEHVRNRVAFGKPIVSFQNTRVPGIRNLIFGGDGLFLAQLTGTGRVWLQTLPISNLAHALQEYLPGQSGRRELEGGVVGGVVGSILDGMRS